MAFRNPVVRPPREADVPAGLMWIGLLALLLGVGLLLHTATVALRGELLLAALHLVLAGLFLCAGCRLWHRCRWALDFLLLGWLSSYVLLTSSCGLNTVMASTAQLIPWISAGAMWIAGIAYLLRWRSRWRGEGAR